MKKFLVVLVMLVLALAILAPLEALAWGKSPGLMLELGLTGEQQEKFLDKKQEIEKQSLELRQKNKKTHLKIKSELEKDAPDKDQLHQYIKQINQNQTEMQLKRIDHMLWMRSQLTPEQKEKFKRLLDQKKPAFRKKKKMRK